LTMDPRRMVSQTTGQERVLPQRMGVWESYDPHKPARGSVPQVRDGLS